MIVYILHFPSRSVSSTICPWVLWWRKLYLSFFFINKLLFTHFCRERYHYVYYTKYKQSTWKKNTLIFQGKFLIPFKNVKVCYVNYFSKRILKKIIEKFSFNSISFKRKYEIFFCILISLQRSWRSTVSAYSIEVKLQKE